MPNTEAAALVGLAALTASVVGLFFTRSGAADVTAEPPAKKAKRKRSSSRLARDSTETLIEKKPSRSQELPKPEIPRSLPNITEVIETVDVTPAELVAANAPLQSSSQVEQTEAPTKQKKKSLKRKASKRDITTVAKPKALVVPLVATPTTESPMELEVEEDTNIVEESLEDLLLLGSLSGRNKAAPTVVPSTKRKRSQSKLKPQQEVAEAVEPTPAPTTEVSPSQSGVSTPVKTEATRELPVENLTPPRSAETSTVTSPTRLEQSLPTSDTSDAQILTTRLSFLDAELNRLKSSTTQKSSEITSLKSEITSLTTQIRTLQSENDALRTTNTTLHNASTQKSQKVLEEMSVLRDTNRLLTQNLSSLQVQLRDLKSSLETERQTSKSTIAQLQRSAADKTQLDAARADAEAFRNLNAQLQEMLKSREVEMDGLKTNLAVAVASGAEKDAELATLKSALSKSSEDLRSTTTALGASKAELEPVKASLKAAEKECGGLKQELENVKSELEKVKVEKEGLDGKLNEATLAVGRLSVEAQQANRVAKSIEEEKKALVGELEKLKKEATKKESTHQSQQAILEAKFTQSELQLELFRQSAIARGEKVACLSAENQKLQQKIAEVGGEMESLRAAATSSEEVEPLKKELADAQKHAAEAQAGSATLIRALGKQVEDGQNVRAGVDEKVVEELKAGFAAESAKSKKEVADLRAQLAEASKAAAEANNGSAALISALGKQVEDAQSVKAGVPEAEVAALKSQIASSQSETESLRNQLAQSTLTSSHAAEANSGTAALIRSLAKQVEDAQPIKAGVPEKEVDALKAQLASAEAEVKELKQSGNSRAVGDFEAASGYQALVRSLSYSVEAAQKEVETGRKEVEGLKSAGVESAKKIEELNAKVAAAAKESEQKSADKAIAAAEANNGYAALVNSLGKQVEGRQAALEQVQKLVAEKAAEVEVAKKQTEASKLSAARSQAAIAQHESQSAYTSLITSLSTSLESAHATFSTASTTSLSEVKFLESQLLRRTSEFTALQTSYTKSQNEVKSLTWERSELLARLGRSGYPMSENVAKFQVAQSLEVVAGQNALISALGRSVEDAWGGVHGLTKEKEGVERELESLKVEVEKKKSEEGKKKVEEKRREVVGREAEKKAEAGYAYGVIISGLSRAVEEAVAASQQQTGRVGDLEKELSATHAELTSAKATQKDGGGKEGVKNAEAAYAQQALIKSLGNALEGALAGQVAAEKQVEDLRKVAATKPVAEKKIPVEAKPADDLVKVAEAAAAQANLIRALAKAVEDGQQTTVPEVREVVVERVTVDKSVKGVIENLEDELKSVKSQLEAEVARADQVGRIRKVLAEVYEDRIQGLQAQIGQTKMGLNDQIRSATASAPAHLDFTKLKTAQAKLDEEKAKLASAIKSAASEKAQLSISLQTYQSRITDLETQVQTLTNSVSTLTNEKSTLESTISTFDADKLKLQKVVSTLQSDLDSMREDHRNNLHALEEAKRQQPTAQLWRQIDDLKNQLEKAQKEVVDTRQDKRGLNVRAEVAERKVLIYKKRAEDAAEKVEELEKKVKGQGLETCPMPTPWEEYEETRELKKKVEEYQAQVESAEHRLVVYKQRAEAAQEKIDAAEESVVKARKKAEEEVRKVTDEKEKTVAELKKIIGEAEQAKRDLASKESQIALLERDITTTHARIADLNQKAEQVDALEADFRTYKSENESLNSRWRVLETELQHMKSEKEKLILQSTALEAEKENMRRDWAREQKKLEVTAKVFEAKWKQCEEELTAIKKWIEGAQEGHGDDCGCGEEHGHEHGAQAELQVVEDAPRDSKVSRTDSEETLVEDVKDGGEEKVEEGAGMEAAKKKKNKKKKSKK
ncbi:hypothetical protein HK097_004967 [Rhizophlyctis rosea]|uniref:Uncharacterized protein n=1 Tax=Rhizophlyctis rosea TaxID=64517 RepID=A0AAD5SFN3_9FUNG|nr:hypothetical protein HK097_004967 [Rhizophlyctis rosea]